MLNNKNGEQPQHCPPFLLLSMFSLSVYIIRANTMRIIAWILIVLIRDNYPFAS